MNREAVYVYCVSPSIKPASKYGANRLRSRQRQKQSNQSGNNTNNVFAR